MNDINARIAEFVAKLQDLYNSHFSATYPSLTPPLISIDAGGVKYRRIVVADVHHGELVNRSVYCFIDLSNGDILKAAGWKGPAKGARGNIFNDNCDVGSRANVYGGGLYAR